VSGYLGMCVRLGDVYLKVCFFTSILVNDNGAQVRMIDMLELKKAR
jgi:hypothetical protein